MIIPSNQAIIEHSTGYFLIIEIFQSMIVFIIDNNLFITLI